MASPQIIRVRAVPGRLVSVPKQRGSLALYVGRRADHEVIKTNERDDDRRYPIDASANATFHRTGAEGLLICDEIRRKLIERDLLPADAVTAAWAGIAFPTSEDTAPVDAEWHRLASASPN